MNYYGRRTNRMAVTVLCAAVSVIGTLAFMITSVFFSLYFGVLNTKYIEKNCASAFVATSLGVSDDDLHNAIEHLVNGLKKGEDPSTVVMIHEKETDFYSQSEINAIMDTGTKLIFMRNLFYALGIISIAMIIFVIASSRVRILRNVFAVFWGLIILTGLIILIYVRINPSLFTQGFVSTLILNSDVVAADSNSMLVSLFPSKLIESAVFFVTCLFVIFQMMILLLINKFTLKK